MTGILSSAPAIDEPLVGDRRAGSLGGSTPFASLIRKVFEEARPKARSIVLFTSVDSGSGVSSTACAVAAELAQSGHKVLLADASALNGLSEYEDVSTLCRQIGFQPVWVLGRDEAAQSRLPIRIHDDQTSAVLSALLENFEHILLDAPSLAESDLAVRLAPSTAGIVLVVRRAKTETRGIVKACGLFTAAGGKILGTVYGNY